VAVDRRSVLGSEVQIFAVFSEWSEHFIYADPESNSDTGNKQAHTQAGSGQAHVPTRHMEVTQMKLVGIMTTAVLSLTLVAAAPIYAQEPRDQQEEQKAKPEEKAQPTAKQGEKNAQQEDKNSKQEEKNAQQQDKNNQSAEKNTQQEDKNSKQEEKNAQQRQAKPVQQAQRAGGGGIPADRFKANFGREHSFRVSQGDYTNRRFQYGGYAFGFVDPWPSNWLYTQDVFVVEIDGVYYLCNPMYPGVNLALSITL
jgi:outer membrane biosynthesis protein TonB